jgi:hypothetical protein
MDNIRTPPMPPLTPSLMLPHMLPPFIYHMVPITPSQSILHTLNHILHQWNITLPQFTTPTKSLLPIQLTIQQKRLHVIIQARLPQRLPQRLQPKQPHLYQLLSLHLNQPQSQLPSLHLNQPQSLLLSLHLNQPQSLLLSLHLNQLQSQLLSLHLNQDHEPLLLSA